MKNVVWRKRLRGRPISRYQCALHSLHGKPPCLPGPVFTYSHPALAGYVSEIYNYYFGIRSFLPSARFFFFFCFSLYASHEQIRKDRRRNGCVRSVTTFIRRRRLKTLILPRRLRIVSPPLPSARFARLMYSRHEIKSLYNRFIHQSFFYSFFSFLFFFLLIYFFRLRSHGSSRA